MAWHYLDRGANEWWWWSAFFTLTSLLNEGNYIPSLLACGRIPKPTNGARLLCTVSFLGSSMQQPNPCYANAVQWLETAIWSNSGSVKVISTSREREIRQTKGSFSRKMTGIEFAVVHEQPPVWVIQKQYRRGPEPHDGEWMMLYVVNAWQFSWEMNCSQSHCHLLHYGRQCISVSYHLFCYCQSLGKSL